MSRHIGMITLVVRDYDEAIEWYTGVLGFSLVSDTALSPTKRWVVVAPEQDGAKLLLAQADTEMQISSIGNQTGGRVALFLYTDDFARDHAAMLKSGVRFLEDPRHEAYGSVAVFEDLYGNTWDLLELK
ncbi:VOC family protein [Phyllobacterium sp. OV277]|uniref:VOC family protein n=1 Tax=Phyllobacterium sp. OV277 TaxID=1882772 RepID=UPI0008866A25|nr:VOC family protein [Phyllobacterium sp. OV277]SDO46287.1 Catechol 2,3-dioxygenase [Phyllobacterium sp. OV277]